MSHPDDDLDYFLREMRGVVPLKQEQKAELRAAAQPDAETLKARRQAAQQHAHQDNGNFLSDEFVELMGPFDPVDYKKEGVQEGVIKRLKRGQYPVDAALNLHKKPVDYCRREVFDFIETCYRHDIRVALISFGKATSEQSLPCVVKSYLARWLPAFEQVNAVCSAHKHHGGNAAVYVLLKKSERQKEQNRQRHMSGRTPKNQPE